MTDEDAVVRTFINKSIVKTVHPSYQAWTYKALIEDYNESVKNGKIILHPCTYLHNYIKCSENDPLLSDTYKTYIDRAPVYRKGEAIRLREFILQYIKAGDKGNSINEIENGKIRPSKSLQDALLLMLDGNEEIKRKIYK